MASVTVSSNPSTTGNTLTVNFTTDATNITDVQITKDGLNYSSATAFTNSSATFNVSSWGNGTYNNCYLKVIYTQTSSGGSSDSGPIELNLVSSMTCTKGAAFNINYTTNVPAVKHEFGFDGSSYWEIQPTDNGNNSYSFSHEAITDTTWNPITRYIRVTDANSNTSTKSISITITEEDGTPAIVLNNISNMTVNKGEQFNILYTTNVPAVKHEISWDGGSTFWDKTSEIVTSNTTNYKYTNQAETAYDSFSMAIRVTDAKGNTSTKSFTITFNSTSSGGGSSNLLDSNGAYIVDDFSSNSIQSNKWSYELGYVRNNELQNYTNTNAEVNDGILALKGIKDSNGTWTGASIISKGHFAFMYGKIECRAKIDPTLGSFSAFWTLGDSFEFGYHDGASPDTLGEWWAWCGEFDVMEFYSGKLTCGTFFNEKEESGRVWYNNYNFNEWHTFAMEWLENGTLIFSIDGHELSRTNPTDNRAFHIPHFILINQAIGASGGTPADGTTNITQYVDWVKYYPASTANLVENSSDFTLTAMDFNNSARNCMVRPTFNDNCINKSLTWSSSNPNVITCHSGLCASWAGANGDATITAISKSGTARQIKLRATDGVLSQI